MARRMPRTLPLLVLALCGAAGCRRITFEDSVLAKPQVRYRVGELPPGWRRVVLADNDLAFTEDGHTGRAIAVNATCEGHDDPPLPVLLRHLLMGFTEREEKEQRMMVLDGREALRARYTAKLDGVPVELDLVVLKKDGCVHDFSYVAPVGQADARRADFDAVLAGFHAERTR
ncbi:hypothetical protein P2318_01235 [Myxococcaceae bacterium GXIMD 01537]